MTDSELKALLVELQSTTHKLSNKKIHIIEEILTELVRREMGETK